MSEDNDNKAFVCSICGKAFPLIATLQRHRRYHTGEAPFLCQVCDKTFIQAQSLKTHLRTHTGQKPITCQTCGSSFTQESSLRRHQVRKRHGDNKKSTKCQLCGRSFPDQGKLERHQCANPDRKVFSCDVCGNTFTQESSLKRHKAAHLKETKQTEELPACESSRKVFSTRADLKNHDCTNVDGKPFVCETCGKSFTRASNLRKHDRKHTGEKPYVCNFCGRAFPLKSELKCHQLNAHIEEGQIVSNSLGKDPPETAPEHHKKDSTGDEPVANEKNNIQQNCNTRTRPQVNSSKPKQLVHGSCEDLSIEVFHLSPLKVKHPVRDFCCEVFSHKWNLGRYQRIHYPENPYRCDHCGKPFPYLWTLECHARSHTEPKQPFSATCGLAFTQEMQLNEPQEGTHTSEEPSGCDEDLKSTQGTLYNYEHLG